ncbi:polysaccharide pyruvyl transferase family protein [Photobacterium leiognathi]|uniref:polysaccharide pyruvyl transferase family protein n=1 Tax=Photobacterium leiognathi TaxID=553611 RepID=UPI00298249DC|nr:polysaccharide pyruvyl transferase family protein [Photobacterium leiognathi]
MKLEYCRSETYNFGDDLNIWLWPKILGDIFDESSDEYFIGIGTLLTEKRIYKQLKDAKKIIIFSSGAWDEDIPILDERCHVVGVRGPRTAQKLNLDSSFVVGDGAYLLRKVDIKRDQNIPNCDIGFIPHHRSEDFIDWRIVCEKVGIKFISPKQPVDDFLADVLSCNKIITEAMHGAIVADALRIPWVGAKFSPAFNEEKWYDFTESMDIKLSIHTLPFMSQKKMPIGKLIENYIKRKINDVFSFSPKWGRLPIITKIANDNDLYLLGKKIIELDSVNNYTLSENDKVEAVTRKLYKKAMEIKEKHT